jgi:hypothetical protein
VLERDLERRFKREVERRGAQAIKLTSPGRRGMPDRLVIIPGGRVVFVELKAPGGRLTPLQRRRADDLRAQGFTVYCVNSLAAIAALLSEVFPEEG